MFRPLRHVLDQIVTTGYLRLIDAKGRAYAFGDHSGTPVVARITDVGTERRLFLNPTLALGECCIGDQDCGPSAFCGKRGERGGSIVCQTRLGLGGPCTADNQCASGFCSGLPGAGVCSDRVQPTLSEASCSNPT